VPGAVNETPYTAPPRATLLERLGPGGLSSLLLAGASAGLALGLPLLPRLKRVLAAAAGEEPAPADAILVLGRKLEGDELTEVYVARLAHAADLWRAGWAPRLWVAGGLTGTATRTEAAAGRDWLLEQGIPPDAVELEEHSQHTLENLFHVRGRLRERGESRLLLVSDPLHVARGATMARGFGLEVRAVPTPHAPPRRGSLAWWYRALREAFFLHWYHSGIAWNRLIGAEQHLARVT
jgi:uncharacterized SAM-binding protein YcdF (DUF218 family)